VGPRAVLDAVVKRKTPEYKNGKIKIADKFTPSL
jgi:hypothetical protein